MKYQNTNACSQACNYFSVFKDRGCIVPPSTLAQPQLLSTLRFTALFGPTISRVSFFSPLCLCLSPSCVQPLIPGGTSFSQAGSIQVGVGQEGAFPPSIFHSIFHCHFFVCCAALVLFGKFIQMLSVFLSFLSGPTPTLEVTQTPPAPFQARCAHSWKTQCYLMTLFGFYSGHVIQAPTNKVLLSWFWRHTWHNIAVPSILKLFCLLLTPNLLFWTHCRLQFCSLICICSLLPASIPKNGYV